MAGVTCKHGHPAQYVGTTKDGDMLTDYFICAKGHKKAIRIRANAETERISKMLGEAPF